MTSKTPRTDAFLKDSNAYKTYADLADFSRQLETELQATKEKLDRAVGLLEQLEQYAREDIVYTDLKVSFTQI